MDKNLCQVDLTLKEGAVKQIVYPATWDTPDGAPARLFNDRLDKVLAGAPDFIKNVFVPTALGQGAKLPVSAFKRNGQMISGTTRYYKRGIAVMVPVW